MKAFHYQVILADPPWPFRAWKGKKELKRTADSHYKGMSMEEIAALEVNVHAADNCALFLWVPSSILSEGIGVLRHWGFDYKTVGFAWTKVTAARDKPRMGMGHYTRQSTELCLLGTIGRPVRLTKNVEQTIWAERREHSRKPDEQYDRIEALYKGPYLELFARHRREGWDQMGNELE